MSDNSRGDFSPSTKAKNQESDKEGILVAVIGTPLVFWGVWHVVSTKTISDFTGPTIKIGIVYAIVLFVATTIEFLFSARHQSSKVNWLGYFGIVFLGIPIVAIASGAMLYGIFVCVADLALWVQNFSVPWRAFFGAFTAGIGGAILFYFRLRLRAIYGFTEAVAGIVIAGYTLNRNPELDFQVLAGILTAGVYLVVRGLDNVHQGLTKEPIDTVALTIMKSASDRQKSV